MVGLIAWRMTWNRKATRSGRVLYQLQASARSIGATGFGLWQSPTVADARGRPYTYANGNHAAPCLTLLGQVRKILNLQISSRKFTAKIFGPETSNGSHAPITNSGQVNPAFVLWLMGYPPEWQLSAPREMRSFRKSRKRS